MHSVEQIALPLSPATRLDARGAERPDLDFSQFLPAALNRDHPPSEAETGTGTEYQAEPLEGDRHADMHSGKDEPQDENAEILTGYAAAPASTEPADSSDEMTFVDSGVLAAQPELGDTAPTTTGDAADRPGPPATLPVEAPEPAVASPAVPAPLQALGDPDAAVVRNASTPPGRSDPIFPIGALLNDRGSDVETSVASPDAFVGQLPDAVASATPQPANEAVAAAHSAPTPQAVVSQRTAISEVSKDEATAPEQETVPKPGVIVETALPTSGQTPTGVPGVTSQAATGTQPVTSRAARGGSGTSTFDKTSSQPGAIDDIASTDSSAEEMSVRLTTITDGFNRQAFAAANQTQTQTSAANLAPDIQTPGVPDSTPAPDAMADGELPASASSSASISSPGVYATPIQAERLAAAHQTQFAVATSNPNAATGSPSEQIAVHIAHAVREGNDRLVVQLRPHSLGRIRVELEVGPDNRVIAVIGVERQETLDLMQRDARGLERALNDAGLKADTGSLSFNLRSDGGRQNADDTSGVAEAVTHAAVDETSAAPIRIYRTYGRPTADGVDIRV